LPENKDLQVQFLARQEYFSGPLPPPAELKGYMDIDPGYPDRLMKLAESHSEATILLKREEAYLKHQEAASMGRGQVFSFALGLTGFGISALFAFKGLEAGAIAAAIGGVAPIIVAAIGNLRK
jgi:uncharacterized membrane protein